MIPSNHLINGVHEPDVESFREEHGLELYASRDDAMRRGEEGVRHRRWNSRGQRHSAQDRANRWTDVTLKRFLFLHQNVMVLFPKKIFSEQIFFITNSFDIDLNSKCYF